MNIILYRMEFLSAKIRDARCELDGWFLLCKHFRPNLV